MQEETLLLAVRFRHAKSALRKRSHRMKAVKCKQGFIYLLFFFLGGKDIHYTSAMIATSRVCDVHPKPKRPKLTTHLELLRHES